MSRPRLILASVTVALAAAGVAACGSEGVDVAKDSPDRRGAELFAERCGGCHTFKAAGTEGSATKINDRERIDGPSFDTRTEDVDNVLFAIRNGGFSGALMPQNIVVGDDAEAVARFVAKYAGTDREVPASPSGG